MNDPLDLDDPTVLASLRRLGWSSFRPNQLGLAQPILEGKDVIGVLPTGAGKSALYQVPTLARTGLTIVISPLIALMVDQVDRLRRMNVPAIALHSACSAQEKRQATEGITSGTIRFLYISPERLQGLDPSDLGQVRLQMVAVDEAHCISEWGHDFRPAYARLARGLRRLRPHQVIALTATATAQTVDEISRVLQLENPVKKLYSPDRPNLATIICGPQVELARMVERTGTPCVVYGGTRASVEEAAIELQRAGFRAEAYHAGLDKDRRMKVQRDFVVAQTLQVVCATNAFGMGVDHPGVRGVVHLEMPSSLEAYAQEIGRAGRDGGPAIAICRATTDTLEISRSMVPMEWPSPERIHLFWNRLQRLFEARPGRWEARNKLHMTNKEIASLTGFEDIEAGSCLRILHDTENIRRTLPQDLPCKVWVNRPVAETLSGVHQRHVIERLLAHADDDNEVTGSVAFFTTSIGMDKAYAEELRVRGAIRYTWAERCPITERLREEVTFDENLVRAIAARSMKRIDMAEGLLRTPECRRVYLLHYFGDVFAEPGPDPCCDRCHVKRLEQGRAANTAPSSAPTLAQRIDRDVSVWIGNRTRHPPPDPGPLLHDELEAALRVLLQRPTLPVADRTIALAMLEARHWTPSTRICTSLILAQNHVELAPF